MNNKIYSYTKKTYLALANLILSFKTLQDGKVNTFLSFSDSFCRKFRPQLLRGRKRSSATHHSTLGKKTLFQYSCQLEIDHVTQQSKETCHRTCRGPNSVQAQNWTKQSAAIYLSFSWDSSVLYLNNISWGAISLKMKIRMLLQIWFQHII